MKVQKGRYLKQVVHLTFLLSRAAASTAIICSRLSGESGTDLRGGRNRTRVFFISAFKAS